MSVPSSRLTFPALALFLVVWPATPSPAARGQDSLSRGSRAILDAALEQIEANPTDFDRRLLDRVAGFRTPEAFERLRDLYPRLVRADHRITLLQDLQSFRSTSSESAAAGFLVEQALGTDDDTVAAATATLAGFGEEGASGLRKVAADARTLVPRFHALHQLSLLAHGTDWELLRSLAQGHELSRFHRLGLPPEDPNWLDRYSSLRAQAVEAIARMPGGEPALVGLLNDADSRVQGAALALLGERGSLRARERAREVLTEKWPDSLKIRAVQVLRQEASEDAVAALFNTARSSGGELRTFALQSLSVMDADTVLRVLLPQMRSDAEPGDALVALELLARTPGPVVTQALQKMMRHQDALVRAAAIRAIGEREDRSAEGQVRGHLDSPNPEVKAAAILTLSKLSPTDLGWRDSLLRYSRSRDLMVRMAALESLSHLADRSVLPRLHQLLEDEDWRIRIAACEGVGQVRSRDSVPLLIERLKSDRRRVADRAAWALRRISAMPFRTWARDWENWWRDVQATFVVPPLAAVEEMERKLALAEAQSETRAHFYGLRVNSDHVSLVVDISGSMGQAAEPGTDESRLEVAKREIQALLAQLPEETHFNVIFFSGGAYPWKRRMVPLSAGAAVRAESFAMGRSAGGATDLFGALELALEDEDADTIYLLSDGQPSAGRLIAPSLIREEIRRRNPGGKVVLHTIAIGWDSGLLRGLAEDTGGQYVQR